MATTVTHKGYIGELEIDMDSGLLVGEVINIKDLLAFHGKTIEEAIQSFRDTIDDYLAYCEKEHIAPERPFSGNIPFRTTPEIHKNMYMASRLEGKSINAWMNEVLAASARETVVEVEGPKGQQPESEPLPTVFDRDLALVNEGIGTSKFLSTVHLAQSSFNKDVHVRIDEVGNVVASIDSPPSRQSEKHALARAAAKELTIPVKNVVVKNTETGPARIGHSIYGRLMTPTMIDAVLYAAKDLKEKMRQIAAHRLEANVSDVTLEHGKFSVAGSPDKSVSFTEVAEVANTSNAFHHLTGQGLESTVGYWEPDNVESGKQRSRKTASAASQNRTTT